jgi:hypothetical protein
MKMTKLDEAINDAFNITQLECLADALAHMRRDEDYMRKMGHNAKDVSELRAMIRVASARFQYADDN